MNQRTIAAALAVFLLGLFAFSFTADAGVTGAQTAVTGQATVWENINNVLESIFVDFTKSPETSAMWIRIFLTVLVFAVVYGILQKVLGGFGQYVNTALAACIALISTLVLPTRVLMGVAVGYSATIYTVMLLVVSGGTLWFIYTQWPGSEPTAIVRIIKGAYFFLMSYVLGSFAGSSALAGAGTTTTPFGGPAGVAGSLAFWNGIQNVSGFGSAVCFIAALWYVVLAFMSGAEAHTAGGPASTAKARPQWARKLFGGGAVAFSSDVKSKKGKYAKLKEAHDAAQEVVDHLGGGGAIADSEVGDALKEVRSAIPSVNSLFNPITSAISEINSVMPDIKDKSLKRQVRSKRDQIAAMIAAGGSLQTPVSAIHGAVHPAPTAPADQPAWVALRDSAAAAMAEWEDLQNLLGDVERLI